MKLMVFNNYWPYTMSMYSFAANPVLGGLDNAPKELDSYRRVMGTPRVSVDMYAAFVGSEYLGKMMTSYLINALGDIAAELL